MRIWRFIIIVGIIFIFERFIPYFWPGPLFIFPVFAILYLISSKDFGRDIPRIFFSSLPFDLFSGFSFGFYTLAILVLSSLIYIGKKRFVLGERSIIFGFVSTILFVAVFYGIYLFELPVNYVLSRLLVAIGESAIIYPIFYAIMKKTKLRYSK